MQMEFTLKNTHATGSEIKEFLEEKTSKLKRFFNGKIHARWNIQYENDEHISHLHVTGNSLEYFGEARDHNILTSIEDALDKVDRQLQRHKEMVQNHHQK